MRKSMRKTTKKRRYLRPISNTHIKRTRIKTKPKKTKSSKKKSHSKKRIYSTKRTKIRKRKNIRKSTNKIMKGGMKLSEFLSTYVHKHTDKLDIIPEGKFVLQYLTKEEIENRPNPSSLQRPCLRLL